MVVGRPAAPDRERMMAVQPVSKHHAQRICRFCVMLIIAGVAGAASAGADRIEAGSFRVSYESRLAPLRINVMHSWILTVETASGDPVVGADIKVTGGMPQHNHGLPTAPRVTAEVEPGRYLVEGMKFHMNGHWQVAFEISALGETETATFELDI